jgi:hypothetical protein
MCFDLRFLTSTRGVAIKATDKADLMAPQFALNNFDLPKVVEK